MHRDSRKNTKENKAKSPEQLTPDFLFFLMLHEYVDIVMTICQYVNIMH